MSEIVTSGAPYLDIDAYSSIVAYAELIGGVAASSAPLNQSIVDNTDKLQRNYQPSAEDTFVVVDTSDPDFFDEIVDHTKISEIVDHHSGFQEYWANKGVKNQIEKIGAAATIIWERWRDAGRLDEMSKASGRLLAEGILDNTLIFLADVASERDKVAYADLTQRFGDIKEDYFRAVEAKILSDLKNSLVNDLKTIFFTTLNKKLDFYQLTVLDIEPIFERKAEVLEIIGDGFLNLISISEGKSYVLTNKDEIRVWLSDLMDGQQLYLRKEVMRKDLDSGKEKVV
jgi:inorganic pyrophosphatase